MTEIDFPGDLARREAEECGDLLDGYAVEPAPRWREWCVVTVGWLCMAILAAAAVVCTYGVLDVVFK